MSQVSFLFPWITFLPDKLFISRRLNLISFICYRISFLRSFCFYFLSHSIKLLIVLLGSSDRSVFRIGKSGWNIFLYLQGETVRADIIHSSFLFNLDNLWWFFVSFTLFFHIHSQYKLGTLCWGGNWLFLDNLFWLLTHFYYYIFITS